MRRFLLASSLLSFACAAVLVACGDDSTAISPATTGDAAPATDTGPGTGDDGGTSSDGASTGDAAPPDSGKPCPAPADPSKASVCIDFAPESIKFEATPDLDGRGALSVYLYATAFPDGVGDAGPATPIATYLLDGNPDGGSVADLRSLGEVKFDAIDRTTVYARAAFIDGKVQKDVEGGWWFGGFDLSGGLKKDIPLNAITLVKGAGTRQTLALIALRRLNVTVTRTVAPVGNAQGPLGVTAFNTDTPGATTAVFGAAQLACANLKNPGASVVATGYIVGPGPYWLLPVLDDYNTGGGLPPGSLSAIDLSGATPKLLPTSKTSYAVDAYIVNQSITLSTAVPRPGGGGDTVVCP